MPRKVIELLASWKGKVGSRNILEVWRMAPLSLMWCIWRMRNAKSFEDCEILAVELKFFMFNSLYACMAAYNGPHFCSFIKLLDFCSFFPYWGSLLYTSCVYEFHSFVLSNTYFPWRSIGWNEVSLRGVLCLVGNIWEDTPYK
jgi:hypothetical protein